MTVVNALCVCSGPSAEQVSARRAAAPLLLLTFVKR
jgi:hypothetical protein